MKKRSRVHMAFIYTVLFVYSFALLKPVFPLITDVVGHTFFSSSHTATVHFENGEYHLHVELIAEAMQQDEKSKENAPVTGNETLANHIFSETAIAEVDPLTPDQSFSLFMQQFKDVCIPLLSPPPEA